MEHPRQAWGPPLPAGHRFPMEKYALLRKRVEGEGVLLALEASGLELAFFLAGADPYQGDRLGRLSISKEALAERDGQTLQACKDYGVPVAVVMAGGYAANIEDTVEIHHTTVRLAGGLAGIQI
jgi:acetoin utilization deacetylase AcuC-like enzyme